MKILDWIVERWAILHLHLAENRKKKTEDDSLRRYLKRARRCGELPPDYQRKK